MAETTDLRRWLETATRAVGDAREHLDAINVFPVPDSDTGTNLHLTLQEGVRAVAALPDDASHDDVAAAFVRASLVAARGNSGVVVSQYLHGFLSHLHTADGLAQVAPDHLAAALDAAATAAAGAFATPVEGTVLTVARAAADAAKATSGSSVGEAMVQVVGAASHALELTRDQLPAAKEAGVVDAGGAGLVLVLEALARVLAGDEVLSTVPPVRWQATSPTPVAGHPEPGAGGAYEVMFVTKAAADLRAELTADLGAVGGSVAVMGAHRLWQAHVHTDAPDQAVEIAVRAHARQILVRNVLAGSGNDPSAPGVVAVTACPGLSAPLADAGAVVLIAPNPVRLKKRALRRAVRDASATHTVVVAGHPHLRAVAVAVAAKRRGPRVEVLAADHEAQVVAAVAAGAVGVRGLDMVADMSAAVAATSVSSSSADALVHDVGLMVGADTDVVTLILGAGIAPTVGHAAQAPVAAVAPLAQVQTLVGGQAWPPVLIGVERA